MSNFIKMKGKNICNIRVYALSTCIWCKRAKTFLDSYNIEYSYVFVDLLPENEQEEIENMLCEYTSILSYPIILSDKCEPIIGYNQQKLKNLIDEK